MSSLLAAATLLTKEQKVSTVDTPELARFFVAEEFRAALFVTGGSQAVRLPAACRFEGSHVKVRKEGNRVILEAIEKPKWPTAFWRWFDRVGPVSDDFLAPPPLPAAPHRDRTLERFDDPA